MATAEGVALVLPDRRRDRGRVRAALAALTPRSRCVAGRITSVPVGAAIAGRRWRGGGVAAIAARHRPPRRQRRRPAEGDERSLN